jgi:uncharacterized membrane protein HdeD (DUF308 family)
MSGSFIRSWWIPALRGFAAVVFALLALMWPGLTLLVLVALFAVYALASGAVAIAGAVRNRSKDADWLVLLLMGVVSLGAGLIAAFRPGLAAVVLVLVMGANAIVTGVLEIVTAVRLRRILKHEWLLMTSGALGVLFGVLVFMFPTIGAITLVWLISTYALVIGILNGVLAYRLYRHQRRTGAVTTAGAAPRGIERRTTPDRRLHVGA